MITRKLHKIDATDKAPGRLATQIATLLRGKNKPSYVPHKDEGDIVEVSNIKKLKFTGKKLAQKKYFRITGYPGGLRETKMSDLASNNPAEILIRAVTKMLPDTRLRNGMMKRLIVK